jgi:O-acetyl-ADP-ribose deacetylase (regulator of RNase III)
MIEKTGDLFESDAVYLGHGVNVCGVMGAGIAKTFREKYPHNYTNYKAACEAGRLLPGGFMVVPERSVDRDGLVLITNLASQEKPGADASYNWLFGSLYSWASQAAEPNRLRLYGGRIAIPEIGCGIGGLEWDKVKHIIETVEILYPEITFEVWHYAG